MSPDSPEAIVVVYKSVVYGGRGNVVFQGVQQGRVILGERHREVHLQEEEKEEGESSACSL